MAVKKRLVTGQLHAEGRDAVFIALTSTLTLNHKYGPLDGRTVPVLVMQMRNRGDIGMPGGKVDEGETLLGALVREVEEECHYTLDARKATLVCTHDIGNMHTHLFHQEVSMNTIKSLMSATLQAEDFGIENCGNFISIIEDVKADYGISKMITNRMASSVLEELGVITMELVDSSDEAKAVITKSIEKEGLVVCK